MGRQKRRRDKELQILMNGEWRAVKTYVVYNAADRAAEEFENCGVKARVVQDGFFVCRQSRLK